MTPRRGGHTWVRQVQGLSGFEGTDEEGPALRHPPCRRNWRSIGAQQCEESEGLLREAVDAEQGQPDRGYRKQCSHPGRDGADFGRL